MSVINGLNGGVGLNESKNISYDNSISGLESTDVNSAIDEIATLNKSDKKELVLLSDNWSGIKAPFIYRLSVDGITDDSTVYVSLPNDATSEQISLVADALLDVSGIGDGYVDIVSRGSKLLVDIPVVVHVCNVIPVPRGRDAYYIGYVAPNDINIDATNVGDAINQLCNLVTHSGLSTDATNIHIDDTNLHTGATNLQEVLEYFVNNGIGSGRKHELITIPSESWEGEVAPYTTSIPIDGVTENTEASIITPFDVTYDQYQVISHAEIVTACTKTGNVVLKAFGDKPKIDLPIDILIYL